MTDQLPLAMEPGVLRNVVLLDKPHALARPIRAMPAAVTSEAVGAAPQVRADAQQPRSYDAGLRAGYDEGLAAGQARQREHDEAQFRRVIEEARAAAMDEGRTEGLLRAKEELDAAAVQLRAQLVEEAEAVLQERLQHLDQLVAGMRAQSQRLAAEAEDDLVALGFEAVCRVLGRRAAEPEVLRGMVRDLLAARASDAAQQLAVHVHPQDHAWLQREPSAPATGWNWVADQTVEIGGVLLRWPHGALDARLETQLDALRQTLLRVREERAASAGREPPQ
ncbi:MAG: FliH/SctL family protein [Pseudomonadota bacterium]